MSSATTVPLPSSPVQVAIAETDGIRVVESVGDKIWAATIINIGPTFGAPSLPIKILKIDKATGLIENTYQAPAGATGSVTKSSVDSTYLWLNNFNSHGITRVKLSDGTSDFFSLGPVNTSANDDIDSDGEFVWVASPPADKVFKVNAATGVVISETALVDPSRIETDGTHVWVAHGANGQSLAKLDRSTGAVISGLGSVASGITSGAVSDIKISGSSLFLAGDTGGSIFERSVTDGSLIVEIPRTISGATGGVAALVIHERTLISLNSGASSLSQQFNLATRTAGVPISEGTFPNGNRDFRNGTHDGSSLWTTNQTDDKIYKFNAPVPVTPAATTPAATTPAATTPSLATTGSDIFAPLALAMTLAASGSALLVWRRSQKRSPKGIL
jgi:hypothetical protein